MGKSLFVSLSDKMTFKADWKTSTFLSPKKKKTKKKKEKKQFL